MLTFSVVVKLNSVAVKNYSCSCNVYCAVVKVYVHCLNFGKFQHRDNLITSLSMCITLIFQILHLYLMHSEIVMYNCYVYIYNFRSHAFVNLRTRINNLVNSYPVSRPSFIRYRWFSRYVIAAMLVDGKQKIAH